jgi:hypothetical protein
MIDAETGVAPEIFIDTEKFDGRMRRRCGSKQETPGLPRGGVISGVRVGSTSIIANKLDITDIDTSLCIALTVI